MEPVLGIEPGSLAYQASTLPLSYTDKFRNGPFPFLVRHLGIDPSFYDLIRIASSPAES
jgi:hypothetical protein